MSGNLCRCGAYVNIVAAIRGGRVMKPFAYQRAADAAGAVAAVAAASRRGVPRRRHQPRRSHEARRRQPDLLVDVSRLPFDRVEELPDGGVRIGAVVTQQRPRRRPADPRRATRCCRRRCWPARPGSCAISRPPAATCCSAPAASISRTSPRPATSARPAPAARRSAAIPAITRSSARRSTASRCIRPTWRWRWRRSMRSSWYWASGGERRIPLADFHRLPETRRNATPCSSTAS